MLEKIFKKRLPKKSRDVVFLDALAVRELAKPLNERAYEIFNNILDRYVDYQMREHVKNKIN